MIEIWYRNTITDAERVALKAESVQGFFNLLFHEEFTRNPQISREEMKQKMCHGYRILIYFLAEYNDDRLNELGDKILRFLDWTEEFGIQSCLKTGKEMEYEIL